MLAWMRHPSLRLELLGCQQCRTLVGYPPFGRMSASSELGPWARERVRRSAAGPGVQPRAESFDAGAGVGSQQGTGQQPSFQRPRRALMMDAMSCSADDGSILSNRAWCPRSDSGALFQAVPIFKPSRNLFYIVGSERFRQE